MTESVGVYGQAIVIDKAEWHIAGQYGQNNRTVNIVSLSKNPIFIPDRLSLVAVCHDNTDC